MRRTALTLLVAGMVVLPAGLSAQTGITPDVVYGHKDGMALTFDVLRPSGPPNGAGVAFMVSGGWVSRWMAPETVAQGPLFQALSEGGYTTFLVRHGSSPRFKVPDAIADARLAVAYIRAHAGDFGVDPERLGITGMSAGGHLSLAVGLRAEGPTGEPDDPANARATQVAAIVAYFPPVDLRTMVGPSDRFPALDFDPELAIAASPLLFATKDDPPTLLLHGDEDTLVPLSQSRRMHDALEKVGVPTDFEVFPGAGHGFRGADAARGVELTVAWFDTYLAPRSSAPAR